MNNAKRLQSLHLLRFVAVILVTAYHFSEALVLHGAHSSFLSFFYNYGKYGVQIFFVVSGFVIPYSLYRGRYTAGDYPRFLLKRLYRLHPPFLLTAAITFVIAGAIAFFHQLPFPVSRVDMLKTFFYAYAPEPNPVFWTLKVEWLFYLFIGLFFPLQLKSGWWVIAAIALLFGWLYFQWPGVEWDVIRFFSYFLLGMSAFAAREKIGNQLLNATALVLSAACCFRFDHLPPAIAGLLATAIKLFYDKSVPRWIIFTGNLSYSIYLLHFIIGVQLINVVYPATFGDHPIILFVLCTLLVAAISWLVHRYVETPAEKIAASVKYRLARRSVHSTPRNTVAAGRVAVPVKA